MKRVIVFLIACLVSINACFATSYNLIVLPSSLVKKTDKCILCNKNLEEILAEELVNTIIEDEKYSAPEMTLVKKTISTNPQLNSILEKEEKRKIVGQIYGSNRVLFLTIKYDIKSLNAGENSKSYEKMVILTNSSTLKLITKVELYDTANNKLVWSDAYCKNTNLETVNNNNFSYLTGYYKKLAKQIIEGLKIQPEIKCSDVAKPSKIEPQEDVKTEFQELNHTTVAPQPIYNSNIKPQLQLKEDVSVEQSVKNSSITKENNKSSEGFKSLIKNVGFDLKKSTPQTEIKPEQIKTTTPTVQPTYTNIHVSPRKNSRNFTPKFDNSVNDI